MVRWVEADPQLAGEDYIHFTPLGAKKIAKLLYDTLHFYYRFYLFRTGQENVELTAEDSAVVNIKQKEQEVERSGGCSMLGLRMIKQARVTQQSEPERKWWEMRTGRQDLVGDGKDIDF